ncbi:hypothetical protein LZZ98_09075 [Acinetobacter sp. SM34]|uniref:glycosyltransferase n=1 Tax=Acinetobacter sp. SM34 TaxID=1301620 RepID=UPI001EDBAF58|nr:glycosyltransferase [Acinetobacter sp. SM34]MCG2608679.1 hypothetical protein [Acinetobacter sp. SM34]
MKKMLVIGDGDSIFVKDFINQYYKKGVVVDLISFGKEHNNLAVRFEKNFQMKLGVNFSALKNFIEFRRDIIDQMDNNYDVIVIHFIYFFLAPHIFKLKKKTKKIVAVVWGSDFYRVTSRIKIFLQNIIYKNVDNIVFTNPKTRDIFLEKRKSINAKLNVARFGLPVLDEIDKLQRENYTQICSDFGLPVDRVKIMVGYNAHLAHQQLLVINQVINFNPNILKKIHLVFPLGYGNKESKKLIVDILKKHNNIQYTVLDKFYNFQEVAKLRLNTDILINIQPTDQFSGSMQETLYAGGWVLTGAWLPYETITQFKPKMVLIDMKEDVGKALIDLIESNAKNSLENTTVIKKYIRNESSWSNNIVIWNHILFSNSL